MERFLENRLVAGLGRLGPVIIAIRTAREFIEDDCTHLAAAIAYYAMFSLFPLLLGLISILGFVLGTSSVQAALKDAIGTYVPSSAAFVGETLDQVVAARGTVGIVATLGFLWSAMSVFAAVRKSLNIAWDISQSRHIVHQKLLDLSMVLAVALLLLLSVALTAAFSLLRAMEIPVLGVKPLEHELLWALLGFILPLWLTYTIFLLVYKLVPNTDVFWHEAAVGAAIASPLFELAKNAYVWYARDIGRYELVYGSVGAVMGLLMWIYVSSLVLLLGAEVASEYGRVFRERRSRIT